MTQKEGEDMQSNIKSWNKMCRNWNGGIMNTKGDKSPSQKSKWHKSQTLTNGGQDLHGPHGGLDVEPELLQGQQALPLEVLQLSDKNQVLLHQGPHGCRQSMVHLAVLKGRLLLNEAAGRIHYHHIIMFLSVAVKNLRPDSANFYILTVL